MTNAKTWTEIPNFCRFLYKTEYKLFFALKCREFRPSSYRSQPVLSTLPWTTTMILKSVSGSRLESKMADDTPLGSHNHIVFYYIDFYFAMLPCSDDFLCLACCLHHS